jgi:hypothetical protein
VFAGLALDRFYGDSCVLPPEFLPSNASKPPGHPQAASIEVKGLGQKSRRQLPVSGLAMQGGFVVKVMQ